MFRPDRGFNYTCRGHSTTCPVSPAGPLEPHFASPNRVLGGGVGKALHPHASLSCATIMLCDLRPRAARALTSRPGFAFTGGSLLASARRARLKHPLTKEDKQNNQALSSNRVLNL